MEPIAPIPTEAIEAARGRIAEAAVHTPLLPLPGSDRIWLKLECLQPIGSFKIRGAANAMALADPGALERGVYTASAGNMAQGVAFEARRRGIPCRVIVPDSAPLTKIEAIRRLGGVAVPLPYDEWWTVLERHGHPDEAGFFVHPVSDPAVIAGNGTVGAEILEELPGVDTVVVPFGGGGLSSGIACALRAPAPHVRVLVSEVDTAAPFAASLEAGRAVSIRRTPSFVDGIGGGSVLEEMWPLTSSRLAGSVVVRLEEIAKAIHDLVSLVHVVAEGAGASALAAARRLVAEPAENEDGARRTEGWGEGESVGGGGPIVAVVSGGNLDIDVLRVILEGETP